MFYPPPEQAQQQLQVVVDDANGPLYHQHLMVGEASMVMHNSYATEQPAPLNLEQLANFVSTMIYLLWHVRRSSFMDLHDASSQHGLETASMPVHQRDTTSMLQGVNQAFRRFCKQIINATQLSDSVVMLSLKYIAKLLEHNPNIQGAEGSEYRVFIVSLMLANKVQDDNTYTNRTWADVSGMKLEELDIMELEFLDVLDFRLFVPKEEFEKWRAGLLGFMTQLENATLMQQQYSQQQMIEATLRNMGLAVSVPDPAWPSSSNNILHHQHHDQAAVAQQQQQQRQYLYLLAKAQPQFMPQYASSSPLTRVPLRIPVHPVYMNASTAAATPSATTTMAPMAQMAPMVAHDASSVQMSAAMPLTTTLGTSAANPILAVASQPPASMYATTMAAPAIANQHNASYSSMAPPSTTSMASTPVSIPPLQQQQQQQQPMIPPVMHHASHTHQSTPNNGIAIAPIVPSMTAAAAAAAQNPYLPSPNTLQPPQMPMYPPPAITSNMALPKNPSNNTNPFVNMHHYTPPPPHLQQQ